mgnify:CR=1 FL=1
MYKATFSIQMEDHLLKNGSCGSSSTDLSMKRSRLWSNWGTTLKPITKTSMDPTLKSFTPGLLTTFQDLIWQQQAKDIIGTCMTCKESLTSISLEVAAALRAFIMSLGTTTFCWITCRCQLKIVLLFDEFQINQNRIYSRHVHNFSK